MSNNFITIQNSTKICAKYSLHKKQKVCVCVCVCVGGGGGGEVEEKHTAKTRTILFIYLLTYFKNSI